MGPWASDLSSLSSPSSSVKLRPHYLPPRRIRKSEILFIYSHQQVPDISNPTVATLDAGVSSQPAPNVALPFYPASSTHFLLISTLASPRLLFVLWNTFHPPFSLVQVLQTVLVSQLSRETSWVLRLSSWFPSSPWHWWCAALGWCVASRGQKWSYVCEMVECL